MSLEVKLLIGLIIAINISLSASIQEGNYAPIDSITHTKDSTIQSVWEIKNTNFSSTDILLSSNWIYFTLDSGQIYCYDFSGKEKWMNEVQGFIPNNSVLYKDLFLAGTEEGDLYSINSNTGDVIQVVGIGENITTGLLLIDITSSNIKSKAVVLGTSDGNIFCYDAFTFELLWSKNISTSPIISTPLFQNDKLLFISANSSLYNVNPKTGSLNWKYEFVENQNLKRINYPLSDGINIFSLTPDGNLIAFDLLLGKKIWSSNTKGAINQFYISSDKQRLFLIDNKGLMTICNSKNGKEIGKIDFKKTEIFTFVMAENKNSTLVGFSDGSLYTFDSNFFPVELISPDQIPITSINVIDKNEFIVKDVNGKITLYKVE
ncbi:MAG TPA: hypothetical protein DHV28_10770 [Ignavibacteriales bacterium]|nr:hypothetical protein [Ignavibacteriales bacterium]